MNQFNMNGQLLNTLLWFEKAVPKPNDKNLHTQIGCHLEEVGEMLETLKSTRIQTAMLLLAAERALKDLATHLKSEEDVIHIDPEDEENLLDALCDQIVTATGVAHMRTLNILGAMNEVNSSNWSKFVNGKPVFDANQKIQKGPGYFKADLSKFLPER